MVGSSKILTVSYGTFSCTLEGFDDPFSTMKSIAEYFRDLAADDRYFGAEPPTPDAEMLHRIAEREVQRRVEARVSNGGIVLRQLEEARAERAAPRHQPAAEPARPPEAPRPTAAAPVTEDSVATKLSRIRAVVDRARATSIAAHPVAPPPVVADDYLEDEEPVSAAATPEPPRDIALEASDAVDQSEEDEVPRPWEAASEADEEVVAAPDTAAVRVDEEDDEEDDEARPSPAAHWFDDEDDEDDEQDDDLARRIVHLSRTGSRTTAGGESNGGADDPTLAGIRMALDVEKQAIEQERKEARMERRHVLIGGDPGHEPAFDRILEETNTKMADREGTRRRSAIAHLKAAVAATKADRLLKRERSREIDEEEQRDYREDLAKVVRPRRSEPGESVADKARPAPLDDGAAPLILGSSQRVDNPALNPQKLDLRPRRVGAAMIALDDEETEFDEHAEDDGAFVAFAERVGARSLPDLLEAAAAYTAFVEGQPSFSRPQIMRRAAAIETDEEFTREAGLRSFGQLLRQGKIRKLQRGQFTISESTRFRPEARIAGE
jgi:methionine-rich copper-binding protein CopC